MSEELQTTEQVVPVIDEGTLNLATTPIRNEYRIAAMSHKHNIPEEKIFALFEKPALVPYRKFFFPHVEGGGYAIPNPFKVSQLYEDLQNPEKKFGEPILGDILTEIIADGGAGSHAEEVVLRRIMAFYRKQAS